MHTLEMTGIPAAIRRKHRACRGVSLAPSPRSVTAARPGAAGALGYGGGTTTPDSAGEVTRLLRRWRGGDTSALERLLPLVYADLRRIAAAQLRSRSGRTTLQTTTLVHDVLLRLRRRRQALLGARRARAARLSGRRPFPAAGCSRRRSCP
jgi:hypothetical protein